MTEVGGQRTGVRSRRVAVGTGRLSSWQAGSVVVRLAAIGEDRAVGEQHEHRVGRGLPLAWSGEGNRSRAEDRTVTQRRLLPDHRVKEKTIGQFLAELDACDPSRSEPLCVSAQITTPDFGFSMVLARTGSVDWVRALQSAYVGSEAFSQTTIFAWWVQI
jgi:hypothetical protein